MSAGIPPYLVPDPSCVVLTDWHVDTGSGSVPLGLFIPDWDHSTDLLLTREVVVDLDRVLVETVLSPEAGLMVVVEWSTSSAQIRGRAYRGFVTGRDPLRVIIKLDGGLLGGDLGLTTRLVLAHDTDSRHEFTACRAGDVLFEEHAKTQLEGTGGRLPTYVVDFAEAGFDPDARWHLELPRSLDQPALAGVRLYLNRADQEIVAAATKAAAPTPIQKRLLDWLETDVAEQLVGFALRPDLRDHLGDYIDDIDSVGASLATLVAVIFPDEGASIAGALMDTDRGRFHSRVQGAVRRMRAADDDVVPPIV